MQNNILFQNLERVGFKYESLKYIYFINEFKIVVEPTLFCYLINEKTNQKILLTEKVDTMFTLELIKLLKR